MIEKKHNYFYKITNLVNGKYYYGIHSTNNLNDSYMGGGDLLYKAQKKYGRKNFTKEIIEDYPTRKEASDHEKRIVTLELVQCRDCYNCRTGGDNEFIQIVSEDTKKRISLSNKGKTRSDEFKALMKEINSKDNNKNIGSKRSLETKKRMSQWQIGVPKSKEHIEKLSIAAKKPDRLEISMLNLSKGVEKSKKSCIVNGVRFESIKEVVQFYQLTRDVVGYRLRTKSEKWKNWSFTND